MKTNLKIVVDNTKEIEEREKRIKEYMRDSNPHAPSTLEEAYKQNDHFRKRN